MSALDDLFEESDEESTQITAGTSTTGEKAEGIQLAPTDESVTNPTGEDLAQPTPAPETIAALDGNEKPEKPNTDDDVMQDSLFDDDDEEEEAQKSDERAGDRGTQEKSLSNEALFESDEEEEEEEVESGPAKMDLSTKSRMKAFVATALGDPIQVQVPSIDRIPKDAQTAHLTLPNVAAIEPREFDPETFDENQNSFSDARAKVTVQSGAVIRWRKVKNEDGTESIESNARIIRWPDGLIQLQIGNEVFSVSLQRAPPESTDMVVVDGADGVSVALGPITSRMRFFPSNLATSSTHRSLKAVVSSRVSASVTHTKATMDFKKVLQQEIESAKLAEKKAKQKAAGGRGRSGLDRYGTITDFDRQRYGGAASDDDDEGDELSAFRNEEYSTRRLLSAKSDAAPTRFARGLTGAGSGYGDDNEEEEEAAEEEELNDFIASEDEEDEEEFVDSEEDEDEEEGEEDEGSEDSEEAEDDSRERKRSTKPKSISDEASDNDTERNEDTGSKRRRIVDDDED